MLKDLCASAAFPTEVASMFRLKFGGYVRPLRPEPLDVLASQLNDVDFCYAVLNKVSRSFAVVIQQLPKALQDPVCIFYLVLRGLDSVEDDMSFDVTKKVPLLKSFYTKLYEDGWTIRDVGDSPDYRILLAHFDKVIRVFASMDKKYQAVIADITRRMGEGMAEYATKTASIDTIASYNLYCHYVAGLVGHGLSALFAASGLEDPQLGRVESLSNSMGLFLQKTNIIRDYLEDLREGRTWWPREIWSQYGEHLEDFEKAPTSAKCLACLNHMVTDALELVPDCLRYLSMLRDRKVFEFCAIPQVMAMATLELCYDNPDILRRTSVKIRKGLSCKLMLHSGSIREVHAWFHAFANRMEARIRNGDPSSTRTRQLVQQIKDATIGEVRQLRLGPKVLTPRWMKITHTVAWSVILATSVSAALRWRGGNGTMDSNGSTSSSSSVSSSGAPSVLAPLGAFVRGNPIETAMAFGSAISMAFLGGFFGQQFV